MITILLASVSVIPTVPDTGATSLLLGVSVISLGVLARFLKNRKS